LWPPVGAFQLLSGRQMRDEPEVSSDRSGDAIVLRLAGRWTIVASAALEAAAAEIEEQAARFGSAIIDLATVEAIDTAGAWIIDRARVRLANAANGSALAQLRGAWPTGKDRRAG
jgi:phospholipid/cholesterol/gamma-HCH transport system permease protein